MNLRLEDQQRIALAMFMITPLGYILLGAGLAHKGLWYAISYPVLGLLTVLVDVAMFLQIAALGRMIRAEHIQREKESL